jgi:hypothetical protein
MENFVAGADLDTEADISTTHCRDFSLTLFVVSAPRIAETSVAGWRGRLLTDSNATCPTWRVGQ